MGPRRRALARGNGQSSLANLLFMRELSPRRDTSIISAAGHPGWAATHLQSGAGIVKKRARRQLGVRRPRPPACCCSCMPRPCPTFRAASTSDPTASASGPGTRRAVGMTTHARNDADAARLWAVSEKLTGVTFP